MVKLEKKYIKSRFSKGISTYDSNADVQKQIVNVLLSELQKVHPSKKFGNVLEIGCGSGILTSAFLEAYAPSKYVANDIAPNAEKYLEAIFAQYPQTACSFKSGDAEKMNHPTTYELVISSSVFQWFSNIVQFFEDIAQATKKDSLFAFATFGSQNYREIKATTGVGLDYTEKMDLLDHLSSNFEIVYEKEFEIISEFDNPKAVLKYIKQLGVNGISKQFWGKKKLQAFIAEYSELYSVNNDVTLTHHPIIIIAKRKQVCQKLNGDGQPQ